MRSFAGMFVGGVAAVLLLKVLAGFVLPLVGMVVGLILLAIKIALFAFVAYFVYSLVKNRKGEQTV